MRKSFQVKFFISALVQRYLFYIFFSFFKDAGNLLYNPFSLFYVLIRNLFCSFSAFQLL